MTGPSVLSITRNVFRFRKLGELVKVILIRAVLLVII